MDESYQKCAADDDKNTTILVAGLGVDGSNLVLDALEGKLLFSNFVSATLALPTPWRTIIFLCDLDGDIEAYLKLADDVGSTEEGRLLKGEHGVFALHRHVSLSTSRSSIRMF